MTSKSCMAVLVRGNVALVALFLAALVPFLCEVTAIAGQGDRSRNAEEKTRYEAGMKAARKLLAFYDKAASGQMSFEDATRAMLKAEDEFSESLRANGREGIEAAIQLILTEEPRRKYIWPRLLTRVTIYLDGPASDWGRPYLNHLIQMDKLTLRSRAHILQEIGKNSTEAANWLDEETTLPIIRSFLKNPDYYAHSVVTGGNFESQEVRMRFCDLGVRLVAEIYKPNEVKWLAASTPLSKDEADQQRNENVEAAKAWVEMRLARVALRPQLLQMVASYWRLKLTRGQIETFLDLWASLESRGEAGNIRDLKALADMLLADLRRTGDKPREALEKDFHRAVHERLAAMLAKAGYRPEGPEKALPRNAGEEREWLRSAVHRLARGAAPDHWMRYEWERYLDELREAVLADIKAATPSPAPSKR